ncbi:MAG: AI-2E family transporter [FCB group bacterium]|nr:AI-2E family transporter [FCB group bacterium]
MRESRLIATFLGIITSVLMVLVLQQLKTVFIPLIFAVLLSIMLAPAIKFLSRFKIPHGISLTVVILAVFFLIYLLGSVIYASVASFTTEFPKYEASLQNTLETTLDKVDLQLEGFQEDFYDIDWGKQLKKISIGSTISSTLGTFLTFLGYTLLILVFTIFLLSGQIHLSDKVRIAFEGAQAAKILSVIRSIQSKVQTYLLTKVFISFLTALVSLIFMLIFGVDFVVVAAVLIFALNFIPNIGSIIATAFPILICFVEYGYNWRVPVLTALLFGTQMIFGNVIEPLMMGRGLNLQPIVVILSLIFWGWVWGIVGMVLAVPLTSTLVIVCESIDSLRPVAILMSGSKTMDEDEVMMRR